MTTYAVGFSRPRSRTRAATRSTPWHAVAAHRPSAELDGEVELSVCGAIVQVWARQEWDRIGVSGTACPECQQHSAVLGAPGAMR